MYVYSFVFYGKKKLPLAAVSVKAMNKPEALAKAKEQNAFPVGMRGFVMKRTPFEEQNELTLEFCARQIVKDGFIRIGKSNLSHCFDGTVSVTDWNGHTTWFDALTIDAVQYFIDCQPA